MSSGKLVQLRCDADGCSRTWLGDSDHVHTARDSARAAGWTRTGGSGQGGQFKDWCPTHGADSVAAERDRIRQARREFVGSMFDQRESV